MKLKLKFNAMQILMAELKPNEMLAFYIMAMGDEMPEQVTKAHLTRIIALLCRKLCWIKDEDEPVKPSKIWWMNDELDDNRHSPINSPQQDSQLDDSNSHEITNFEMSKEDFDEDQTADTNMIQNVSAKSQVTDKHNEEDIENSVASIDDLSFGNKQSLGEVIAEKSFDTEGKMVSQI